MINFKAPQISVVMPCYNEEVVLPKTMAEMKKIFQEMMSEEIISKESLLYFIDDGSTDQTWSVINSFSEQYEFVSGIKLSKNKGHQNAVLAGLFWAEGDAVISIDADLQDDVRAIIAMVDHFVKGNDVVYGVRSKRDTDTFFKRWSAQTYYKMLRAMGIDLVNDHADFRLLSRRAIDELRKFKEVNLFLRGIVPMLGFPNSVVRYERNCRAAGESKYPLTKMLAFAIQGITSLSNIPLRLITGLGFVVSTFSFLMIFWVLAVRLIYNSAVPGWASIVIPMFFLGGVQLLSLGIVGEYISKIYMETKSRPRYVIEKIVGKNKIH